MSPRLALVAAAGALLLVTGACDPKPSSPGPADIATIDFTAKHTITVDDEGFDPPTLEVEAGDVITIENTGDEPHSATADTRFDTGLIAPGESTTLVLSAPGTIPYHDTAEPDHTAELTVTPAPTP